MLAIFSTFPLDKGQTLGKDVSEAIRLIDESGLDYQSTAMGTIVEGEWNEVMELVKKCHHKLRENSKRVYTKITIDDREGAEGRIKGKLADVERILGREVRK